MRVGSTKAGVAVTDDRSHPQARLVETFVMLADTLASDFDVTGVIGQLSRACVELLYIDAAGLLLADERGQLHEVAASDERSRLLALLELRREQGPCLDSFRAGELVASPDLTVDGTRWPHYARAARDAGFMSVHALPLRVREETIGAMTLLHHEPTAIGADVLHTAQALAEVATIGILQHRRIRRSALLAEQLQTALGSRVVIEQAKGVLAAHGGLDMAGAFVKLRRYARHNRVGLSDVARRLASRELDPDEVLN